MPGHNCPKYVLAVRRTRPDEKDGVVEVKSKKLFGFGSQPDRSAAFFEFNLFFQSDRRKSIAFK